MWSKQTFAGVFSKVQMCWVPSPPSAPRRPREKECFGGEPQDPSWVIPANTIQSGRVIRQKTAWGVKLINLLPAVHWHLPASKALKHKSISFPHTGSSWVRFNVTIQNCCQSGFLTKSALCVIIITSVPAVRLPFPSFQGNANSFCSSPSCPWVLPYTYPG